MGLGEPGPQADGLLQAVAQILQRLVRQAVHQVEVDAGDAGAIAALLDAEQPDEIYHLAGDHATTGQPGEHGDRSVCAITPWLKALRGARGTRLFVGVSAAIFGAGDGAPVRWLHKVG